MKRQKRIVAINEMNSQASSITISLSDFGIWKKHLIMLRLNIQTFFAKLKDPSEDAWLANFNLIIAYRLRPALGLGLAYYNLIIAYRFMSEFGIKNCIGIIYNFEVNIVL
jgi:hypothetical protein